MTETLSVLREDAVARLVLNRPEKKNALDRRLYEALIAALAVCDSDASIRAVVIAGAGGVFTAGNDLADFAASIDNLAAFPALRFIRAVAAFGKPLIAAVEGDAIGIGATMLFHCDLVYATPDARFRMPFVDLGVVPEGGASLLVPRRLGFARAAQYLLLCESFDAAEARRMGLVNAIASPAELIHTAMDAARRLAQKPPEALAAARAMIRGDAEEILRCIDEEAKIFRQFLTTPQARARIGAFLARKG